MQAVIPDLCFSVIEDSAAFLELEPDWRELYRRVGTSHYCQDFSWCWRVWECVASRWGRRLRLIVGRQAGRVVLIWPLMLEGRVLRCLSSDTLEYRDVLVEESEYTDLYLKYAWNVAVHIKGVDFFLFQNSRSPSNLERLIAYAGRLNWSRRFDSDPVIRLAGFEGWDAYAATLRKSLVGDQKRQWRRAGLALPALEFVVVRGAGDIDGLLDWMFFHKFGLLDRKGIGGRSFRSAEVRDFFGGIARDALERDALYLSKLCAGPDILSAGMGYKFGKRFLFHMFSYDRTWENLSPSRLLLEKTIRWCFDNGIEEFDFMPGGGDYKLLWTNDRVGLCSYSAPKNLRGALAEGFNKLVAGVRPRLSETLRKVAGGGFSGSPVP